MTMYLCLLCACFVTWTCRVKSVTLSYCELMLLPVARRPRNLGSRDYLLPLNHL